MPPVYITAANLKYLSPQNAAKDLRGRALKDPRVRALRNKALADGFKPVVGKEAGWGFAESWLRSDKKKVTCDVTLESLSKPGSSDAAGVLVVEFRSGNNVEKYEALLIAPNGNYEKAQEFYPTAAGNVRRAKSFWTRFKACARRKCAKTCITALGTCIPASATWVAYLVCFAAACGGCLGECFACAGCRCRWWCKWAAGCCRD